MEPFASASEPSRLRLRAYLGDEAARRELGLPLQVAQEPLYEWSFGIGAWGQPAAVRAALAAAELCEALRRERHGDGPRAADVTAALAALEGWLRDDPPARERLRALLDEAWLDGREDWLTRTALVTATSAMTAAAAPPEPPTGYAGAAARAVLNALRVAPEARVREVVRTRLLSWSG